MTEANDKKSNEEETAENQCPW